MKMRILLTGSNGFVAQKFCEQWYDKERDGALLGISRSPNRNSFLTASCFVQCDLAEPDQIANLLAEFKPTHILHTAALSSVESCGSNPDLAQRINVDLTKFLGDYAVKNNIHLTFLSTDFVFDGKNGPYREEDTTAPINAYGQSKIDAEQQLRALNGNIAILRTILVYGCIPDTGRSNLILWAKKQLEQNHPIRVVNDQWRMPTWVDDLAHACLLSMQTKAEGIFHISGSEMYSIEEIVHKVADYWKLDRILITSISAQEIGQAMNRPAKTGFILDKAKTVLGFTPTPFVVSLQRINEQLKHYDQ